MTPLQPYQIRQSEKSDKKDILRFYKAQRYSARFIGLDCCYFITIDNNIIGSVLVSQLIPTNLQFLLHALAINKSHQRQGLAKALLNHVQSKYQPLVCFANQELSPLYLTNGFKKLAHTDINDVLTEPLSIRFNRYLIKQPRLKVFISQNNNDKNDL